jgi:hypothetical protein
MAEGAAMITITSCEAQEDEQYAAKAYFNVGNTGNYPYYFFLSNFQAF